MKKFVVLFVALLLGIVISAPKVEATPPEQMLDADSYLVYCWLPNPPYKVGTKAVKAALTGTVDGVKISLFPIYSNDVGNVELGTYVSKGDTLNFTVTWTDPDSKITYSYSSGDYKIPNIPGTVSAFLNVPCN